MQLLMYAMETFRASSSGGGHMLLRDEDPADPTVVLHYFAPEGGYYRHRI